jgi:hypothetical protein
MGSSQSDQEFHCPECGALLTVGADHCWKCRREFQTAAESPPISSDLPPFSREPRGNPLPLGENGIRLFKTLGALVVIVVAAGIAFFATCFGGFFAGSAMAPRGADGIGWGFATGLIAGGVAALIATGSLVWLFWLRPRKKRRPQQ